MTVHEFQPHYSVDHIAHYWVAGCSCGWDSAYTHAAERYARDDWAFHVEQVEP